MFLGGLKLQMVDKPNKRLLPYSFFHLSFAIWFRFHVSKPRLYCFWRGESSRQVLEFMKIMIKCCIFCKISSPSQITSDMLGGFKTSFKTHGTSQRHIKSSPNHPKNAGKTIKIITNMNASTPKCINLSCWCMSTAALGHFLGLSDDTKWLVVHIPVL